MPYVAGMGKQETISFSLNAEQVADLDRVAAGLGCSREELIETAIGRFLDEGRDEDVRPAHVRLGFESSAELDAFVQVGVDAVERGDIVPHEDVERLFDEMIARQRARPR